MADAKITGLGELAVPARGDVLPIVDDPTGSPVTNKALIENVLRGRHVTVAASDSSANWQKHADYVCDGTADEVQINAAIGDLPAVGGVVQLSPGNFTIAAVIVTTTGTMLVGAGMGATIITLANSSNVNMIQVPNADADDTIIMDMALNGNKANQTTAGHGILTETPTNLIIQRVYVHDTYLRGMYIYTPTIFLVEGCVVIDCGATATVNTNNAGIVLDTCTQGRIVNNHVQNSNDSNIVMRGSSGSEIVISGNTVINGNFIGIATGSGKSYITIANNTVRGMTDNAIDISNSTYITVTGNSIENCGQGIVGDSGFQAVISANAIDDTTGTDAGSLGSGIHYGNSSAPSTDIITVGNVINEADGNGIEYDNIQNGVIANNIVKNSSQGAGTDDGIWIGSTNGDGSTGLIISGNRCYDDQGTPTQDYGLTIGGTGTANNLICNNDFSGNVSGGISAAAGVGTIRDNLGYITENYGAAASVADGGTIAHGLATTPTVAVCNASTSSEFVSVTALDATNITVAIKKDDGTAGTTQTIYWRAYV